MRERAAGIGAAPLRADVLADRATGGLLPGGVSRRTVMKGAAWSVPVLMLANAAPAFAASAPPPVDVGHLMESSGHVNDLAVDMSSIYVVSPDWATLNGHGLQLISLVVTIAYSGDGSFSLAGAKLSNGDINDNRWEMTTISADTVVVKLINTESFNFNTGFTGFVVNYNNSVPASRTISLSAVGIVQDPQTEQTYQFSGAVQANTNGQMASSPAEPIIGPYYSVPGGYSSTNRQGLVAGQVLSAKVDTLAVLPLTSGQLSASYLAPSVDDGQYTDTSGKPVTISTAGGVRTVTFADASVAPWHFDAATGDRDAAELAAEAATAPAGTNTDTSKTGTKDQATDPVAGSGTGTGVGSGKTESGNSGGSGTDGQGSGNSGDGKTKGNTTGQGSGDNGGTPVIGDATKNLDSGPGGGTGNADAGQGKGTVVG